MTLDNGSLCSYGLPIFRRDNFVCSYCGLDGKVWPNYLYFSVDHLLPGDDPRRDDPAYLTTACTFCNGLRNRKRYDILSKTPAELIEQKRAVILERRREYQDFWERNVRREGHEQVSDNRPGMARLP